MMVQDQVKHLLTNVWDSASLAKIRLLGYPPIFRAKSTGWVRCPGWAAVSEEEANFVDSVIATLNRHLELAVADAKELLEKGGGGGHRPPATVPVDLKFVPVAPFFKAGACDFEPKQIRAVVPLSTPASFRPTGEGYKAMWAALNASFRPTEEGY